MSSLEKLAHSSYESYSETAKAYDVTRVPVGLAILIERFSTSGLALAHQHVLDVGCGTGNYLDALKNVRRSKKIFSRQAISDVFFA